MNLYKLDFSFNSESINIFNMVNLRTYLQNTALNNSKLLYYNIILSLNYINNKEVVH